MDLYASLHERLQLVNGYFSCETDILVLWLICFYEKSACGTMAFDILVGALSARIEGGTA